MVIDRVKDFFGDFEGLCIIGGLGSLVIGGGLFVFMNPSWVAIFLICAGIIAFSYGAYKNLKERE